MKTLGLLILVIATLCPLEQAAFASQLIEKTGRFEINWSTGQVRFYGTALLDSQKEDQWRSAEQRAWGDGIAYFQKSFPEALAKRTGSSAAPKSTTSSQALAATRSVNTIYFGDSRVKVTLESQWETILKNSSLTAEGKPASEVSPEASFVVLKVSQKTSPTALWSVIDDSGSPLVTSEDMAKTLASSSNPLIPRWYKRSMDAASKTSAVVEVAATVAQNGALQVTRSDWKPEYTLAVAHGRAAVVIP